ncbi:hypothetical protein ETAA8_67690 [Anatilimnocola aggregata]|uniref:Transmembrane protein n=1 Tax=Anatilimnocola aggregata TaxID=2528021 RepID=A0A517YN12_9BACT|nr:hypothetical protein [Anatilimnocola aggregata]QDU31609.1 hypothetical protein ETAA8_67690 [Anatilimnocola aggregata]
MPVEHIGGCQVPAELPSHRDEANMPDEPLDAVVENGAEGEEAVAALPAEESVSAGEDHHTATNPGASWREIRDNPWLLLSVLFFVTGALGLHWLWQSKAFSTRSKILLSFAVLAWTALLIGTCALVVMWSYGRIVESLG